MATKQQKEELMAKLKFTPRTYTVSVDGYGGEIYAGTIPRKVYDYFKTNNISIDDWDSTEVPEEFWPYSPGCPYECDNIAFESGATLEASSLHIYDEYNQEVWTQVCEGVDSEEYEYIDFDNLESGSVVFIGSQGEKGNFFEGNIELTEPFNPNLLKITYVTVDDWSFVADVLYNGESIDNTGYSTTGKWSEHKWFLVGEE